MKKKGFVLLVTLIMCFGLCSCGGGSNGEETSSTTDLKEITFDEGTIVCETEQVKVEIVKFFEEEIDWADEGIVIEKNVTLKVTNLSDVQTMFGFGEIYIGDEGADSIMCDGNAGPLPGKSKLYTYHIQKNDMALDDLNQLFELNGLFEIHLINPNDDSEIEYSFEEGFDFSNLK